MDIKEIIKNSLLNEVGDASKTPFRYKRDSEDTAYEKRMEKDNFQYVFTTKEGFKYRVGIERELNRGWYGKPTEEEWRDELATLYSFERKKYVNLRKLGADREDLKSIWGVGFEIIDGPKKEITVTGRTYNSPSYYYTMYGDMDMERTSFDQFKEMEQQPVEVRTVEVPTHEGYDEPNKGEFYRIMATVVKIVKNHIERHNGRILYFRPYDERRGRVFTHFVMKQIPGSKIWKEKEDNDFYFLLNI